MLLLSKPKIPGLAATSLANLRAWYQASHAWQDSGLTVPPINGGKAGYLPDLSMHGNTGARDAVFGASPNTDPTYTDTGSGPISLQYNAANQYTVIPSLAISSQGISMAMIVRLPSPATQQSILDIGNVLTPGIAASGMIGAWGYQEYNPSGRAVLANTLYCVQIVQSGNSTNTGAHIYRINGLVNTNVNGPGGGTSGTGSIGKNTTMGGFFGGKVYEVAVWNRALTPTELIKNEKYLTAKYGIPVQVPTKVLAFRGDSLTQAAQTGCRNSYPAYVVLNSTGAIVEAHFVGKSGEGVYNYFSTRAAADTDIWYNSAFGTNGNILCVFGGTNDIANFGQTDVQTYNAIVAFCQARQAVGWKVVVATLLPRTGTMATATSAAFETARLSVNASIRANYATFANGLADVGADSTIGPQASTTNTTYWQGDQTHLTDAGYALVAAAFQTPVNTLLAL